MNGALNRKIGRRRQRMLAPDWETHRLIQMSNAIKENRMFNFTVPSGESIQEVILDITGRGKRRGMGIFVAPHLLVVNALAAELLKNTGFMDEVFSKPNAYPLETKLAVIQIVCTGYVVHSKRQDLLSKYPEDVFVCKEVRLRSFTKKYITSGEERKEVAEVLLKAEEMVDYFLESKDIISTGEQNMQMQDQNMYRVGKDVSGIYDRLSKIDTGMVAVCELLAKYQETFLGKVSENTNLIMTLKGDISNVARPAPITKLVDVAKLKIQDSVLKLFPKIRLLDKRKTGVFVLDGVAQRDVVIGKANTKNYKLVCNVLEYSGLEQNKSELYALLDTPLSKKLPETSNFRGETRPAVYLKFKSIKNAIANLNKLFKESNALSKVRFVPKKNDGDIVTLLFIKL